MKLLAIALVGLIALTYVGMSITGINVLVWNLIGPQMLVVTGVALAFLYLAFESKNL